MSVAAATRRTLSRAGYHARPAFIVIGAQKCGTTALHRYLELHPRVVAPRVKELRFFDQDRQYARGLDHYHAQLPLPHRMRAGRVTFDNTPSYIYYPKVARRIHEYHPTLHLIALVRDPVDRAYSHWNMFREFWEEGRDVDLSAYDDDVREGVLSMRSRRGIRPFDELVRDEIARMPSVEAEPEPSLVRRSLYAEQLERFLALFGPERLLVLDSADLRRRRPETLRKVLGFVGLPEHAEGDDKLHHARHYESPVEPSTRALLREFFAPHDERLAGIAGATPSWMQATDPAGG